MSNYYEALQTGIFPDTPLHAAINPFCSTLITQKERAHSSFRIGALLDPVPPGTETFRLNQQLPFKSQCLTGQTSQNTRRLTTSILQLSFKRMGYHC